MNENLGGRINPKEQHFSVLPHEKNDERTAKNIEMARENAELRRRLERIRISMEETLQELDILLEKLKEKGAGVEEKDILEIEGSGVN